MNRDLFGTDGVRGVAGQYPLDHDGARRIGMALAAHFAKPGEQIIIGCDPRESSAGLVDAVSEGLMAAGVTAVSVGVIPTPGVAYLTREHSEFVAGIMITASHNPYQYNGIKAFDASGGKLSDEVEAQINHLINEGVASQQTIGQRREASELVSEYEGFLVGSAPVGFFNGMHVATDSANGAGSGLMRRVFERLGAEITSLGDEPDGQNINDHCGANHPGALSGLVLSTDNLDLGIAVDGDADRLLLVDARGQALGGDHLLYILAVANGMPGVVTTVMTNMATEQALLQKNIEVKRVKVGDRYILEGLEQTGWQLGVEQSGHVVLPQLLATGDALLAAIQLLVAVQQSGKTLEEWHDELILLPQSTVNIEVDDKTTLQKPAVQAYIATQEQRLAEQGRLLIRPSGTEPLVRIMVEAPDADILAEEIAQHIKELL